MSCQEVPEDDVLDASCLLEVLRMNRWQISSFEEQERNEERGYKSLTYLHSGNAASGKLPGDIKNEGEEEEEEEAPFMKRGLAFLRKESTGIVFFADTFMVEDAVEAIGFGKFQWKLSVITGLAWASKWDQDQFMIIT
ncbi:hypothetical protein EK904_009217 [Melospiza melodia maxima]|nr:hypothetical protein EK904_009217 [Melospiza melodia maxima]